MDTPLIHTALTIIGIILVYAVLARGLLYAGEPFRAKCLDLYEKLVMSKRADPHTIARMDSLLDDIYSNWMAWRLALLVICAVVFVLPYRKLMGQETPTTHLDSVPEAARADFERFTSSWILATVSNSPAAALIFAVAALVGIAFFVPLNVIAKILSSHTDSLEHRAAH
jgi:hypothetical protein